MPEMTYRLRNILIAAVLAVAAVALTMIYVSHARVKKATAAGGTHAVLVAARDIPVGTTGAQLASHGWVVTRKLASGDVASDAVGDVKQLAQLVATQPTYSGEQLVSQRFGSTQDEGVVALLHGKYRIIQVEGDANQLLAGTLKDGNRVDVVGSIRAPESGSTHYADVFLRNVLVVTAADKPSSSSTSDGSTSSLSIDLRVTSYQAQQLFWLEKNADWSLLLRPSVHPSNAAGAPVSAETITEGSSAR
jgi:pilus assembly protein CpaB